MLIALSSPGAISVEDSSQIRALAAAIASADGQPPLSDQALSQLAAESVEHRLARDGQMLIGYAQLDGRSLEIASELPAIGDLLDSFSGRPLLVWSHGRRSRLAPVLSDRGFQRERGLYQLRRSLRETIAETPPPAGVTIRPFVVGQDEDAQLRVNAVAFADHREQGSWTRADLESRENEPWFDADGFLLAWRGPELVGFHWTKIHPGGIGEVYVVGVAPSAQGIGLGSVLILRGLIYLRDRGCEQVLLYVDDTNAPALRMYQRFGFHEYDLDVQWSGP